MRKIKSKVDYNLALGIFLNRHQLFCPSTQIDYFLFNPTTNNFEGYADQKIVVIVSENHLEEVIISEAYANLQKVWLRNN